MSLRLTIVSSHRDSLGERAVKEFGQSGGTIGRSQDSDWILADGQRYVSSRHASIDFRSGSYYIVDTSTNGVYVNGADHPVGRGKPQRLFNGDRIRIGEYEMLVAIDDDAGVHLIDEDHIDPVDLAQRVEAPATMEGDLVDACEITGVGIEMLLTDEEADELIRPSDTNRIELRLELEEESPESLAKTRPQVHARPASQPAARAPAPAAKPQATRTGTPLASRAAAAPAPRAAPASLPPATGPAPAATAQVARTPPAAPAARPTPREPQPSAASLPRDRQPGSSVREGRLDAFFRGAGISPPRLDPRQADAMLLALGQLMREVAVGISENLHLRADQKNALRLPNTTIQPRGNNPLKFSASVEEALLNLLLRTSEEYLAPVEAMREAFGDIKQHQQMLLHGVRVALERYVARLDPDELEQKFSRGKTGMLANAANKLKYWDLYKDLYQVVAYHAAEEFPTQFLEDFAEAYEQELARVAAKAAEPKARAS